MTKEVICRTFNSAAWGFKEVTHTAPPWEKQSELYRHFLQKRSLELKVPWPAPETQSESDIDETRTPVAWLLFLCAALAASLPVWALGSTWRDTTLNRWAEACYTHTLFNALVVWTQISESWELSPWGDQVGTDISVHLLTYLWVALGGDSIDPKPETHILF